MWCASVHEVAPNSAAAAAGKVSRRRQPIFGRRAGAPAGKVAAARLRGLGEGKLASPLSQIPGSAPVTHAYSLVFRMTLNDPECIKINTRIKHLAASLLQLSLLYYIWCWARSAVFEIDFLFLTNNEGCRYRPISVDVFALIDSAVRQIPVYCSSQWQRPQKQFWHIWNLAKAWWQGFRFFLSP